MINWTNRSLYEYELLFIDELPIVTSQLEKNGTVYGLRREE